MEKEFNKLIGSRVHSLRKKRGLSQTVLAKQIDSNQSALCRVEKGTQSLTPWQIKRVAEIFNVRVGSLLRG
jgi:transcriptional regulator with XRE-family HTH domain